MAAKAANDIDRKDLMKVVDNRTVGEILRDARLERDIDLQGISEMLRIRKSYIEAIEENRLPDLPGMTYAVGFVRTYATSLDLETDVLVSRFKQEASDFESRTRLNFPEPIPGSRVPTGSIIFIAFVLLAASYGGWLYLSNKDRDVVELVPELPTSLARLITPESVSEPEVASVPENTPVVPGVVGDTASEETQAVVAGENSASDDDAVAEEPIRVQVEMVAPSSPVAEETPPVVVEATVPVAEVVDEQAAVIEEQVAEGAAEAEAATQTVEESVEVVNQAVETVQTAATADVSTPVEAPLTAVEELPSVGTSTDPDDGGTSPSEQPLDVDIVATAPAPVSAPDPVATPTLIPELTRDAPSVFGSENTNARVELRALSPTWVEISDASGQVLLTRLLLTGDVYRVPAEPGIELVTGNAGGLEVTVDGNVIPPLGPAGEVRRDVELEAESLLAGTAAGANHNQ